LTQSRLIKRKELRVADKFGTASIEKEFEAAKFSNMKNAAMTTYILRGGQNDYERKQKDGYTGFLFRLAVSPYPRRFRLGAESF
jgi:hypothetical protein